MHDLNPFDSMYLYGPWRVDCLANVRRQNLFPTIAHWYEMGRFDARSDPDLFAAGLLSGSPKLVRKFALRHSARWKTDWSLIRTRVLLHGLVQLRLQNSKNPVWGLSASEIAQLLLEHGVDERQILAVVQELVSQLDAPRLLVLGSATAPPREVGKKLSALQKRPKPWALAFWLGKHVHWELHDWADTQRFGIAYSGSAGARLSSLNLESLLRECDQAVIFERRGGGSMERAIRACRGHGLPLEVVLWSDDSHIELPETSIPVVAAGRVSRRLQASPTDDLFASS